MTKRERMNRQRWMRLFEELVLDGAPQHAGKIDWNEATHFFNIGLDPMNAALRFVQRRADEARVRTR